MLQNSNHATMCKKNIKKREKKSQRVRLCEVSGVKLVKRGCLLRKLLLQTVASKVTVRRHFFARASKHVQLQACQSYLHARCTCWCPIHKDGAPAGMPCMQTSILHLSFWLQCWQRHVHESVVLQNAFLVGAVAQKKRFLKPDPRAGAFASTEANF